jgi:hypothetical protein
VSDLWPWCVACGTDGLIQLWSCGTQDVIAKWANDDQSPVHCLSLMDDTAQLLAEGDYPSTMSDNEAETDGKVVFAGLDNGETLGVDIRARGAVRGAWICWRVGDNSLTCGWYSVRCSMLRGSPDQSSRVLRQQRPRQCRCFLPGVKTDC